VNDEDDAAEEKAVVVGNVAATSNNAASIIIVIIAAAAARVPVLGEYDEEGATTIAPPTLRIVSLAVKKESPFGTSKVDGLTLNAAAALSCSAEEQQRTKTRTDHKEVMKRSKEDTMVTC